MYYMENNSSHDAFYLARKVGVMPYGAPSYY